VHSGRVRLEIPGKAPVSLNQVGGRPNPAAWRRFKSLWGKLFEDALVVAQARGELPPIRQGSKLDEPPDNQLDFVEAAAAVRFTTNRVRDEGNYRATLEKALGDALVGDRKVWPCGRWLPDDRADHFAFREVALYVNEKKPALTVVHFDWRREKLF
jgi:hypothetical protein